MPRPDPATRPSAPELTGSPHPLPLSSFEALDSETEEVLLNILREWNERSPREPGDEIAPVDDTDYSDDDWSHLPKGDPMTTITDFGLTFRLPPRGRYGYQIHRTLRAIVDAHSRGERIALYAAQGLRGRAKSYGGRYKDAFVRFARANPDLLYEGAVGPRGGYGFSLKNSEGLG